MNIKERRGYILENIMRDNNPLYNEEDLVDHHGVGVILFNENGEILMLDHVKLNMEVFPVGKVKQGETIFQGICNEVFEETNLEIKEATEIIEFTVDLERNGRKLKQVNHIFVCYEYMGDLQNKEPLKHRDIYFTNLQNVIEKEQKSYMVNVFKDAYKKGYVKLIDGKIVVNKNKTSTVVDGIKYKTKFIMNKK